MHINGPNHAVKCYHQYIQQLSKITLICYEYKINVRRIRGVSLELRLRRSSKSSLGERRRYKATILTGSSFLVFSPYMIRKVINVLKDADPILE